MAGVRYNEVDGRIVVKDMGRIDGAEEFGFLSRLAVPGQGPGEVGRPLARHGEAGVRGMSLDGEATSQTGPVHRAGFQAQ